MSSQLGDREKYIRDLKDYFKITWDKQKENRISKSELLGAAHRRMETSTPVKAKKSTTTLWRPPPPLVLPPPPPVLPPLGDRMYN